MKKNSWELINLILDYNEKLKNYKLNLKMIFQIEKLFKGLKKILGQEFQGED